MLSRLSLICVFSFFSNIAYSQNICNSWGTVGFAESANGEIIEKCIAEDPGISETFDDTQWTVVHQVAAYGTNKSALQALIDAGADPLVQTEDGRTLLHLVASNSHDPEILRFLLGLGIDVNAKDERGQTALHKAVDIDASHLAISVLIEAGANTTVMDNEGKLPLDHILHYARWPEKIPQLLSLGLSFSENPKRRFEILSNEWCNEEHLQPFVDMGWDFNLTGQNGQTLMHHAAARCEKAEEFVFFEEQGVPLDAPDNDGNTPLMVAVDRDLYHDLYRERQVFEILADLDADPMHANAAGLTPWDVVNENNNLRRSFLSAFDIDLDVTDAAGQTLLHREILLAIESQEWQKLEDYVEAGADLDIVDNSGRTPLHVALDLYDPRNFISVVVLNTILDGGPNPTIPDPEGQLPVFEWLAKWESGITFSLALNTSVLENDFGLSSSQISSLTNGLQSSIEQFNLASIAGGPMTDDARTLTALLADPFDVNTLDKDGLSILYKAVTVGISPNALGVIVGRDADLNFRDARGTTILSMAINDHNDFAAAALLAAGADPNIADEQGRSALHYLARRGNGLNSPLLAELMKAGADFRARDAQDRLPIEVAREEITNYHDLKAFESADRETRSFWERWFH